ncbi:peroxidasin homolog, partial [Paramuricea clavata]
ICFDIASSARLLTKGGLIASVPTLAKQLRRDIQTRAEVIFNVTSEYIVIQSINQLNRDGIKHMFMQWGQFLDHDQTLAPESENGDICEDVPCNGSPEDDVEPCFPILPAGGRPCIRLIRSAARCPINGFKLLPREQINVNTAYIDGSMIYGSSESVANAVRDLSSDYGLLQTSGADLLPIDNSQLGEPNSLCENLGSCFLAGDTRVNEQAALAAMHTLWVREHNKIATGLRNQNRHWDGERIYQETRRIVGALVQQITYEEWLPIAIGRDALSPYRGYRRNVNSGISNAYATAAFRLGHSLVRPKFEYLGSNFQPFPFSPIPLNRVFFNNTQSQVNGVDGWIIGMLGNVSQEMDNEMAIGLTDNLFERPNIDRIGLNLAALNMQRGREHGLPFYSAFLAECQRRFPGLYPVDVSDVFESIKSVYNNKPQNTDLFPAGIGELPTNREFGRPRRRFQDDGILPDPILGPTFTCLLIDQFERARDGDRFFYPENSQIPMNLSPWRETVTSCVQRPCRFNGVFCENR